MKNAQGGSSSLKKQPAFSVVKALGNHRGDVVCLLHVCQIKKLCLDDQHAIGPPVAPARETLPL
eukprot:5197570-Amphidinium_carterae.1